MSKLPCKAENLLILLIKIMIIIVIMDKCQLLVWHSSLMRLNGNFYYVD